MKPDIEYAKEYVLQHQMELQDFSKYSTGYIKTNEDIRTAVNFVPWGAKNVLTVAASGDHPMYMMLRDVQNVDTFDVSYNAKLIMDIKTTALQLLCRSEYIELIKDLCHSENVGREKNMPRIMEKLSSDQQEYIKATSGCVLFGHGISASYRPFIDWKSGSMPTKTEFNKMRANAPAFFNFIWSDITSLHTKLDKNYDFMHLSNIYDCMDFVEYIKTLISLMKYTKPGSVIYYVSVLEIATSEWIDILKSPEYIMLSKEVNQEWQQAQYRPGVHALRRVR